MKLISIKFCNFRQFYGKSPEIFIASGGRNATVIHGTNGSGKTAILNGLTWAIYEKFSPAFLEPKQLVNKRAINEINIGSDIECSVEVVFEHELRKYNLKRKCYAHRKQNGLPESTDSQISISCIGEDGKNNYIEGNCGEIIAKILPESLHRYFFFDGEHIDHIFRTQEKHKIADDTKELLGVKVIDRAIEHLKKAKKTLQEELDSLGDIETKKSVREHSQLEQERDNFSTRNEQITQELNQIKENKDNLSQELINLQGAKDLKKIKEQLELQEKQIRQNLIDSRAIIKKAISTQSYNIFLEDKFNRLQNILETLKQKGQLPNGIKKEFVEELLKEKICICGRELTEGESCFHSVEKLLNQAGVAKAEEATIRLATQAEQWPKNQQDFWQVVDKEQESIARYREQLSAIETQLEDIKDKLRHYPDEEIRKIQKELDILEGNVRSLTLEQGSNSNKIEILSKKIEELEKHIKQQRSKVERQDITKRRVEATLESINCLIEVRKRLENRFRISLERKVQEIFSSISFKAYQPRLSEDYQLNLIENTSGIAIPVAASTGENQILSLSFIGAIIDQVRTWSKKNTLMGPDSSSFPIVMDSPFGSLDESYRRQVSKNLPKLANQLIILASQTQWRIEVEQEITPYIGREYILIHYSPKEELQEEQIEIAGQKYSLVKRSPNNFEYTEILEVNRRETEIY